MTQATPEQDINQIECIHCGLDWLFDCTCGDQLVHGDER